MRARLTRFIRDEAGSISIMAVTWIPVTLAIGGLALDTSNAMRVSTQLQAVADAGAHAALYARDREDQATARAAARSIVEASLPPAAHGNTLRDSDIVFGTWDPETETFTPDEASRTAVQLDLSRVSGRGNAVGTWLLGFVGRDSWDVSRVAIFETWRPACLREGFVAEGVVDLRSNNEFYNGFCVHSNAHVELQQNNYFEDGVVVSMPDSGTVVIPASGFDKNEGLEDALRDGSYNIRILGRLDELISEVGSYASEAMPDYISASGEVAIDPQNATAADFVQGRIHRADCGGSGRLTLPGETLSNVVIVTDCEVKFSNGAALENSVLATTSTAAKSITAPNGLRLGADDNCAEDGGAQILTMGGVDVASGIEFYGGQIVAAADIEFTANADGIEGASLVAGGGISGTSNMTMGFCGSGMEDNFEVDYFRLAY